MNIAIIPARGGSKRIPRKNIREFCGQPIIKYSIDAALSSGLFDHVVVSTDCDEIRRIAQECGATTPFDRPRELADDLTPTIPVVRHAITWVSQHLGDVAYACCIYATAPFLESKDLVDAYACLVANKHVEFAFPVTSYEFPIFRSLKIEDGRLSMFWPEHNLTRSQDLPQAYHDAGLFYWGTAEAFANNEGFFNAYSVPLVLPRHRVQDIDTEEDWTRAESLFRATRIPG